VALRPVQIPELDSILAGRKARGGRGNTSKGDPDWIRALPTEELKAKARHALSKSESGYVKQERTHVKSDKSADVKLESDKSVGVKVEPMFGLVPSVSAKEHHTPPPALADPQAQLYQLTINAAGGPTADGGHQTTEGNGDSLEELEKSMGFGGVAPNPAVPRKPRAAGMKRPAAATMKRPAAAMKRPSAGIVKYSSAVLKLERTVDMSDVWRKLNTLLRDPNITRNKFTSRAYGNAKARAKAIGATDHNATEYARMMIRKASAIWANHFS